MGNRAKGTFSNPSYWQSVCSPQYPLEREEESVRMNARAREIEREREKAREGERKRERDARAHSALFASEVFAF